MLTPLFIELARLTLKLNFLTKDRDKKNKRISGDFFKIFLLRLKKSKLEGQKVLLTLLLFL